MNLLYPATAVHQYFVGNTYSRLLCVIEGTCVPIISGQNIHKGCNLY